MLHRFNNLLKLSGSTALTDMRSVASMNFKLMEYVCYSSKTSQRIKASMDLHIVLHLNIDICFKPQFCSIQLTYCNFFLFFHF